MSNYTPYYEGGWKNEEEMTTTPICAEALNHMEEGISAAYDIDPGETVPSSVRIAIYTLLSKAAYIETGLADEVAVVQAWASEVTAITISASAISISGASTSQLSAVTTPAGGAVTWESSNTAVATVSNTGLVTGVSNGTAVITARSGDVSATCTATVSGFATLTGIIATYTQSGTVYTTASLDDLKTDLVVTASYDDSSTAVITDYTLSGTLATGTSTITVSYGGFTDTFDVTVSGAPILPSAYQQVKYIQSTGTQHIMTDLRVCDAPASTVSGYDNITDYSLDIDMAFDSWQSAYATNIIFSFGSSGGNWFGYLNGKTDMGMGSDSGAYFTDREGTNRHQYNYAWNGNIATVTRDDGASVSRQNTGTSTATKRFCLFFADSSATSNFHFNGKLYECALYKDNEEAMHLYPCYRKADGEVGLYDIVNDVFYTNAGTGTFEKGDNV